MSLPPLPPSAGGQPPQQPPHQPQHQPAPGPRPRRGRGPLVAAGVAVAVLAIGGTAWAVVATTGGGDPTSVEEVAEQAVDAARDLDVDAGVRLMCETPSADEREELEDAIAQGQDYTGNDDLALAFEIRDAADGPEGSVRIDVEGDQAELEGATMEIELTVVQEGDRSCIDEVEILDGTAPDGYDD